MMYRCSIPFTEISHGNLLIVFPARSLYRYKNMHICNASEKLHDYHEVIKLFLVVCVCVILAGIKPSQLSIMNLNIGE